MRAAIKEQWISALNSGEYEQTKGALRRGNRFCCLGVLCNLHAITHPEIAQTQTRRDSYMGECSFLPEAVSKWAGIADEDIDVPLKKKDRDYTTLSELNDSGNTFVQIAQIIETYVKTQ